MKKIIPFILTTVILTFINAQCKKEKIPSVLPPITQEGKNTIGFKVDGQVWVPYYKCYIGADPCGEISAIYGPPYTSPNHFGFQVARKLGSKLSSLTAGSLFPITTTGNKYDSVNIEFIGENSIGNSDLWGKSLIGPPGIFEITRIDLVNEIVSGIFSFTLYEKNGSGRTLQITDGRFDFKMNACICK